jgi:hypothetical protein
MGCNPLGCGVHVQLILVPFGVTAGQLYVYNRRQQNGQRPLATYEVAFGRRVVFAADTLLRCVRCLIFCRGGCRIFCPVAGARSN